MRAGFLGKDLELFTFEALVLYVFLKGEKIRER